MSKIDAVKKASYETRKKIYSGGLKGKALKRARNKFNKLEREIRAFKKRSTSESGIPLITIKAKRKAKIEEGLLSWVSDDFHRVELWVSYSERDGRFMRRGFKFYEARFGDLVKWTYIGSTLLPKGKGE